MQITTYFTHSLHKNPLFSFSSRRRHTRFSRDWSSDVCPSDLADPRFPAEPVTSIHAAEPGTTVNEIEPEVSPVEEAVIVTEPAVFPVTVFVATPLTALTEPVPVTEPVPPVCWKLTRAELEVTV